MNILGISCHYHESAAALLIDGNIVAASAEERFSRQKHDADFPKQAIDFCLRQAGIVAQNLDYVVFYEKPLVKFERILTTSLREFPKSRTFFVEGVSNAFSTKLWIADAIVRHLNIPRDRILFVPQHLSHAAASFYPSPFARSAFLTLDAVGEWSTGSWGVARGTKLYPRGELRFPHSVGLFYSAFTALLGFEVNDGEYKVMGMAAYGKPKHMNLIKKLYTQHADGSISLDMSYFCFHQRNKKMNTEKFDRLFNGLNRFDIAASIQTCTEEIILTMMTSIYKKTHENALVFGGGVALNSVINGLITKKTPFKHVFIYPAAGDDGGAIGAALHAYHHVLGHKKRYGLKDVFLGQQYSTNIVEQILEKNKIYFKELSSKKLVTYISDQLSRGKVVGWFEGKAEFGPRALGHRSILADPRNADMKNVVNAKIKFREEFRPFAPVVLKRFARSYFDITEMNLTPFMLGTFHARDNAKKHAPAVVHEDGTSRIQIVDSNSYPGNYAHVLEAFYKITGVPILMNTSFNLKGEPIVNSPEDAISTFQRSGLDILVLEKYVITK
jgi:carbamoyltransferase